MARGTASRRTTMHGLGRAYPFLMNDILRADDRRVADERRRRHRMPDAPSPPPEPTPEELAARARRVIASWIGRRMVTGKAAASDHR
jgi:hypothetical protein